MPLTEDDLHHLLVQRIGKVNIEQIKQEVESFVSDPGSLAIWSKYFFLDIASRIKVV